MTDYPYGTAFPRGWKVTVDTTVIAEDSLDVEFEITRTIHSSTNKCTLTIYNLSAGHRAILTTLHNSNRKIRVEICAGYTNITVPLIFRGDLRSYTESFEGGTYTSVIEGNDGGRSVLASRVNQSYPPGTQLFQVITDMATALGVGTGNLGELQGIRLGTRATFPDGTVTHGNAARELARLLRGTGYSYSIQNGALQFLAHGACIQTTALELNPGTGLLSALPGEKHTFSVKSEMVPDIYPGRYLHVQGAVVQGYFRANTVKWNGETGQGGQWVVEATCKALHTSVP